MIIYESMDCKKKKPYANIIIDITTGKLDRVFSYRIPEALVDEIEEGKRVLVPFGNGAKLRSGFVVELTDSTDVPEEKLREIDSIEEGAVPVEANLIRLAAWMKRYFGGTMNQALKTVLPVAHTVERRVRKELSLDCTPEEGKEKLLFFQKKHYVAKERLLSELIREGTLPQELVTQKLNVTAQTITSLEKEGLIQVKTAEPSYRNPIRGLKKTGNTHSLNAAQKAACERIISDYREGKRRTYLLHGVTGSGKTEVYMEIIAYALSQEKQVIMLIPEIALTYQTVIRFYDRFGDRISILNSRMSKGERYDQYLRAKRGEISVMIGPRSALFTPFLNLAFIFIDEEHETSYKSETVPRYHTRETARELARLSNASVVLGSATPSLESCYLAEQGEFVRLTLPDRVEERPLPACRIVDLRKEMEAGNRSVLSRALSEALADRLERGEQAMLFLNRRGMSGNVTCRSCGETIKCPHCDVSLSLHQSRTFGSRLLCHYCGYSMPFQKRCPSCGSPYIGTFRAGTQKVEETVKEQFPNARILRMDKDTTSEKNGHEKILSAFANHEADILIGTQMIVKGHDFPDVTLMGVLLADMSLYAPDPSASERTFQLLTQAAGRAGRGERPGEVVIQTYSPDHYSITCAAAQDYAMFYEKELAFRKTLSYPPVAHFLQILSASKDEDEADAGAKRIFEMAKARAQDRDRVLGPADAAVAKVKDIYKKVVFMKSEEYDMLIRVKDEIEAYFRDADGFRNLMVRFDFDPMNGF